VIESLVFGGLNLNNINNYPIRKIETCYVCEKNYEPFQNSTIEDNFITINSLEYEIGKMINKLKENNINVLNYWIPYSPNQGEKVTLFLNCALPESIQNDYEKMMEFELKLFDILEEDLKNSNNFHMVGLL